MTDLEKNPSYQLGYLEGVIEQAIIDLLSDRAGVVQRLAKALGAPEFLTRDEIFDWIRERRGG